jgi:hypothetical protein
LAAYSLFTKRLGIFFSRGRFHSFVSNKHNLLSLNRHQCSFNFGPWAQFENEIKFIPFGDKVLTSYFSENGTWTFYNSRTERTPDTVFIGFSLYLKRKPLFALVNFILPIIFMAFLNTIIFAIPKESGEHDKVNVLLYFCSAGAKAKIQHSGVIVLSPCAPRNESTTTTTLWHKKATIASGHMDDYL